jgi:non-specific serine/threonine protein kinase/serine/threonine-protein kinase
MPIDPPPGRRPPTSPADFARLEALFDAAIALEGDARVRAMADAGRLHPHLQAELEALVAAHDRLTRAGEPAEAESSAVTVGSRIGAYRLTDRLGEGGMGEVFRAERADGVFAAEVAVKLTRASLASADLLRRFRVERQILASLAHPNIVRLLDGGATDSGQAYLIMEHVPGVPLTQHCRTQRLPLAERLEIFRAVCDAVQYAHQHAVVHRDLKPANVLVGAAGVPKVVDFGIAKLLDDPAGTGVTTVGVVPGPLTPNYASPEQLRGLPVTTAADIYALGVMLYELVAGVRPYETQGQTLDRVLEIVVHHEPARPSAAHIDEGEALPYPRAELRGDVDAIVRKAMHKDPAHRYASAGELAADITRLLDGDPIFARPPSAGYVLRRIAARHKAVVAVTALALLAIVAALGTALWQRQVARREQARAEQRFRDVRQLANALIFKIHDAVSPLPGSTPVRRTIVDEAIGYLERLEAESAGDVPLRLELAAAYRQLGSILGDPRRANLGDRSQALALYERSHTLVAPLADGTPHYDVIAALVDGHGAVSAIYTQQGDSERAIATARESLAYATRFEAARPGDDRASNLVGRASFMLAALLPAAEARPVWEQTLALYERQLETRPDDAQTQRNVALVGKYLGGLLETAGDVELARTHYARALELDEKRLLATPDDQHVQFDAAISFATAASIAQRIGDIDAAVRLFERSLALRRALVEADPRNMQARHRLGYLLARMASLDRDRDVRAARAYAREAIRVLEQVFDATGDRQSRFDLGFAWLQAAYAARAGSGRAEACSAFRQAMQHFTDPAEVVAGTEQTGYAADAAQGLAGCSAGQ